MFITQNASTSQICKVNFILSERRLHVCQIWSVQSPIKVGLTNGPPQDWQQIQHFRHSY